MMRISPAKAIELLKRGEVVAIPTETVYGLAADARNELAIAKIYATKQRPANNPLIVHIASAAQVTDWASEFPPLAQQLAQAFWPGPLTLVLPARAEVSQTVRAGEPTVALRVPAHPVALALLHDSGLGLAAPSANKYTQLSPTTAEHVESGLGHDIPVLDGGACQVGIESTIVSVHGDEWQLLRPGMIETAAIAAIAGKPATQQAAQTPKVPGQHLLHYSPRTPCLLFASIPAMLRYAQTRPAAAALLFGNAEQVTDKDVYLPKDPAQAAEQLYAALHTLDAAQAEVILIESPPATPEWDALRDRLQRAAYHPHDQND
ncbi:L-threonylcarbamoyladenylate synthase [Methylophilus sp. Q8]|uniref:L-threonylcarbamoyladenylate synthase n=1 Tax=Methylophilus sp. Q8 TaxID=1506586 RepID=UPI000647B83D|nr:L-threonylcarbamoyladenylate synthase [Methylophilus sp. Q8]